MKSSNAIDDQRSFYRRLMKHHAAAPLYVYKRVEGIEYVEHPVLGCDGPVVAIQHSHRLAVETDFYDCDDFYALSDYNYVMDASGVLVCVCQ